MLDSIQWVGKHTKLAAAAGCAVMLLALPACFGGGNGPEQSPAPTGTAASDAVSATPDAGPTEEPAAAPPSELVVADVSGHPAEEAIVEWLSLGAAPLEDERFRPNEMMTRGDWFEWLIGLEYRDLRLEPGAEKAFSDVDASLPYADVLEGYAAEGLIEALPDGGLQLDGPLTREQVPYTWSKFMGDADAFRFTPLLFPSVYLDVEELDELYRKPLSHYREVYAKTFGKTPYLKPKQQVTRAEAAEWMVYVLAGKSELKQQLTADGTVAVTVEKDPARTGIEQAGAPTDIAGHRFESDIKSLLERVDLPGGGGLFEPDETITRGEFIRWAYNYHSKYINPHHPAAASFSDLTAASPYYDIVEGLKAAGILNGFPDGTIRVDEPLTREQTTRIWADYMRDWTFLIENLFGYEDADQVGELYVGTVSNYLVERATVLYRYVFIGDGKRLEPQKPVTRAEAAAWIVQGTKEEEGE